MWRLAGLALVLAACTSSSASDGTAPVRTAPDRTAPDRTAPDRTAASSTPVVDGAAAGLPDGFERVAARVTEPDGTVCEVCLWLADDADQRRRGLMSVTDLGPAVGMAFRYPEPSTRTFWMKDTVLPLSIAFFDEHGEYLGAFDMNPCADDPCPRYRTAPEFVVAVETLQGGLADAGIVPGSSLELLDLPCP